MEDLFGDLVGKDCKDSGPGARLMKRESAFHNFLANAHFCTLFFEKAPIHKGFWPMEREWFLTTSEKRPLMAHS